MANKPDDLAGTQRAAILLMSLGEQDAANVLKQLDAREVQKLGIAMAELKEVSREQMTSVLEQVHRRRRCQGEHRRRIAGLRAARADPGRRQAEDRHAARPGDERARPARASRR